MLECYGTYVGGTSAQDHQKPIRCSPKIPTSHGQLPFEHSKRPNTDPEDPSWTGLRLGLQGQVSGPMLWDG